MTAENSVSALIMPAMTPCYNASLIDDTSDVKSERYKPPGTGNNRVRRFECLLALPFMLLHENKKTQYCICTKDLCLLNQYVMFFVLLSTPYLLLTSNGAQRRFQICNFV